MFFGNNGVNMNSFDEYLNEVFGTFEVCGCVFTASEVLKALDRTAYTCYKHDHETLEEECYEG